MTYQILDDRLIESIAQSPTDEQNRWLVLAEHPEFPGQWLVQCLNRRFFFDFEDIIGVYRTVAPSRLESFLKAAQELGYRIAFTDPPEGILGAYDGLNEPPPFSLNSTLAGTIGGLLPFQLQGFNFLKDLEGGVALWSTGTGKSVLATALLKYHLWQDTFDTAWLVVKAHNKINLQRTLYRLGDLRTVVVMGDPDRREEIYNQIDQDEGLIVITNYEKFRDDFEQMQPLFTDRRILCLWDEMPTKLKNRNIALYKAVNKCLYRSAPGVNRARMRPSELRQWMLSATPIENEPEDFFSCTRLIDPAVYGTVAQFRAEFVGSYNFFRPFQPETWQNLDRMGMKAAHIIHKADKDRDPEIKRQFPKVISEPYYIDWDEKDRKVYDEITKEIVKELEKEEEVNVLGLIAVMQMICDAPSMVNDSAARRLAFQEAGEEFAESGGSPPKAKGSEIALKLLARYGKRLTNERHTKLQTLHLLLTETHSDEKTVVFSAFNKALLPTLSNRLEEWGICYLRYDGKQDTLDRFQEDPSVKVLLSSDRGSDSIDLYKASVVIHFDLPWKWSTLTQRENRIHRVISEHETVRYYTLMMADSIEDRKREIIARKQSYHEQVFENAVADQSLSATMSREDLLYILLGSENYQ